MRELMLECINERANNCDAVIARLDCEIQRSESMLQTINQTLNYL